MSTLRTDADAHLVARYLAETPARSARLNLPAWSSVPTCHFARLSPAESVFIIPLVDMIYQYNDKKYGMLLKTRNRAKMPLIEASNATNPMARALGDRENPSRLALPPMPGLKGDGRRIISHGFTHLRTKEREDKHRITLRDIGEVTGLSTNTIQKFVSEEGSDVTGASISAVSIMADFLGVSIEQLITVERIGNV